MKAFESHKLECDGKSELTFWPNPSAAGIQRKLPDRNSHAINAQVSKSKNPWAICNNSDIYFWLVPVFENFG